MRSGSKVLPHSLLSPFALVLAGLLPPLAAAAQPVEPEARGAEAHYARFLEIYRDPGADEAALERAMAELSRANDLEPGVFRYRFGLGAVNQALSRWEACVDWMDRAASLASSASERESAAAAREVCRLEIARVAVRSWGGPGLPLPVLERGGTVDLPDALQAELSPRLPPVEPSEPADALLAALRRSLPGANFIERGELVVGGFASAEALEARWERSLATRVGTLRTLLTTRPPERRLVVLIAESPAALQGAMERLHPEVAWPERATFLGVFDPADGLVAAVADRSGDGALLHELVHAFLAGDAQAGGQTVPPWLDEGLATLFERTLWTGEGPRPIPNWRMTQLDPSAIGSLTMATARVDGARDPKQVALTRLLLLFVERQGKLSELLARVRGAPSAPSLAKAFSNLELGDAAWREFVGEAFRRYRADMAARRGRPTNPDRVRWVQRALNTVGDAGLEVDGVWGPGTEEALRAFQREEGLEADGRLDPATSRALRRRFNVTTLEALAPRADRRPPPGPAVARPFSRAALQSRGQRGSRFSRKAFIPSTISGESSERRKRLMSAAGRWRFISSFTAVRDLGPVRRMAAKHSSRLRSSASWGTTRATSPSRSASSASIFAAVNRR